MYLSNELIIVELLIAAKMFRDQPSRKQCVCNLFLQLYVHGKQIKFLTC